MATLWVLLREENEYDQFGKYFVAAWSHKPNVKELKATGIVPRTSDPWKWILAGGGRVASEGTWYMLIEQEEGVGYMD